MSLQVLLLIFCSLLERVSRDILCTSTPSSMSSARSTVTLRYSHTSTISDQVQAAPNISDIPQLLSFTVQQNKSILFEVVCTVHHLTICIWTNKMHKILVIRLYFALDALHVSEYIKLLAPNDIHIYIYVVTHS